MDADFFAQRAATWDEKFPDDGPRFERAVAELAPVSGAVAVDLGCGTGRALPYLRAAVGPEGTVVALDLTLAMLTEARDRGRLDGRGGAVRADAARLPLADESCDALFAAGLLHHLDDPAAGLREFARIARPRARLALFHPIGRTALAARHGRRPDPHDIRGEAQLRAALARTAGGSRPSTMRADRYLALAVRTG